MNKMNIQVLFTVIYIFLSFKLKYYLKELVSDTGSTAHQHKKATVFLRLPTKQFQRSRSLGSFMKDKTRIIAKFSYLKSFLRERENPTSAG